MSIYCSERHFLRQHLLLPLLLFIMLALLLEFSELDLHLSDLVYQWSGSYWRWRDHWLTQDLLHEGGRKLSAGLALVLLLLSACSFFIKRMQPLRRGLLYVLASALLSALVINVLKEVTHVDCPWDLLRYGGTRDYIRTFEALPQSMTPGACFPAGHASAGWAWFGLYFAAREYVPAWRKAMLLLVLLLGLVFGAAQELRGAHFLSHDLWTLGICWFIALSLYLLCFRRCERRSDHLPQPTPDYQSVPGPRP